MILMRIMWHTCSVGQRQQVRHTALCTQGDWLSFCCLYNSCKSLMQPLPSHSQEVAAGYFSISFWAAKHTDSHWYFKRGKTAVYLNTWKVCIFLNDLSSFKHFPWLSQSDFYFCKNKWINQVLYTCTWIGHQHPGSPWTWSASLLWFWVQNQIRKKCLSSLHLTLTLDFLDNAPAWQPLDTCVPKSGNWHRRLGPKPAVIQCQATTGQDAKVWILKQESVDWTNDQPAAAAAHYSTGWLNEAVSQGTPERAGYPLQAPHMPT